MPVFMKSTLGFIRMLAKRFPYAIYYDITDELIVVIAALDLRRNPVRIRRRLSREHNI